MSYDYRFTVFTPTFNRSKTLQSVYDSLVEQTFKDFEWLIVDDGSTDDTKSLVQSWELVAPFAIRYFYQENQGKHIAFNYAVQCAKGELFLTADSDDTFVANALETFDKTWSDINEKDYFSAVTALCIDENGNVIGDRFPQDICDSDSIEMQYVYRIKGEKWGFHKTDILKMFPFPSFKNEKFLIESTLWNQIAQHYKTRFINVPLRIYKISQDSLSLNTVKLRKNNICSTLNYYDSVIGLNIPYWQKFFAGIHYVRFMIHSKVLYTGFRKSQYPFFILCMFLLGYLAYLRDKIYE